MVIMLVLLCSIRVALFGIVLKQRRHERNFKDQFTAGTVNLFGNTDYFKNGFAIFMI